ncbi:hypothetical protein EUTSA_v10001979mg [Eutrema salsugineum]|uniref:RPM1 interacting protein 13 n=1 Tax=Eutrema salsugineum TaxID=72664 RepID=V4LIN9_EUTSA|nr:uncharacterized protein LOC18025552 isoform X2 [Eutrema salsugineum]ESQ50400.1 hypothetical protein EUTSA_v10001979mg [Eutrema salsugineum]
MGSGNHVVVDVSSDDEVDSRVDISYFDWLNQVMEAVDEKSDSTDVVEVISEVKGGIDSQYRKPIPEEEDDDCVILDGDPDKTAKSSAVEEDDDKLAKNDDDDDDDDDVLVVGQKACRDFPHPRHSCAKYSFNSTSHEKYCDMCHCYVCDIRAPCPYWCIGDSTIDHCHANDKEKIWKNQREYFRTGIMPTQPSSKPSTTPLLPASATVTRQFSRSPTQNIIRLSQNVLPRKQVGIRACSSSTRVASLSNVRARSRTKQHNANHVLQNRPVHSVRNNIIQKDRSSSYMGNLRSRVASSGTRYGATNGNNIKVGLCTNAQVSQSTHHGSSVAAPTINQETNTQQQRNCQLNVTDYYAAVTVTTTGSQSNVYTRHSGQNKSVGGNCQFQTNAQPFALPETRGDAQAQTVQQPPGANENVLQTKLSEFESWLMDGSNQTGLVSPLPEPAGEDYVSPLTFDFETFLND